MALGLALGFLTIYFLEIIPRNKLLVSGTVILPGIYSWLLLVIMGVLSAGTVLGSAKLATFEKDSSITPLVRSSLAFTLVLNIGDLLFSLNQFIGLNSFRWLIPLIFAFISKNIFEFAPSFSSFFARKPILIQVIWGLFSILFLLQIFAFTILPAQRSSDVVQLYAPLLDAFRDSNFSTTDPSQGNLWWYFLARGRGLDIFLAKEFGADLHTFISTLFLGSTAFTSAALTQFILPQPKLRTRYLRLIPPLSAVSVLMTPAFPSVIGRFHTESFAVFMSLILSIAILLKQRSTLAITLATASSVLIVLQIPIMTVYVSSIWFLFALLKSGSIKTRVWPLCLVVLNGFWGLTVILLNVRTVGIGDVSPFQIFKYFVTSKLQNWTSIEYLNYLNNSQGFSGVPSTLTSFRDEFLAFLYKSPLWLPPTFSQSEVIYTALILLALITVVGATFFRRLPIDKYQIQISCLLVAVSFSWIILQTFFSSGSLERLLFAQYSFISLFVLSASILLSRSRFQFRSVELFPKLIVSFLALTSLIGISNSASSTFYSLPRINSLKQRSIEAISVVTGTGESKNHFIYEPYFDLEICTKLLAGTNSQGRVLILNSATLHAPLCFAQYRQQKGLKFVDSLDVELGLNFASIMGGNPKRTREAFERAGIKHFVIIRNDPSFFGAGLSPIFSARWLSTNLYIEASSPLFFRLTFDPNLGRKLVSQEIVEISHLRELAITLTPYSDGLTRTEKETLIRQ